MVLKIFILFFQTSQFPGALLYKNHRNPYIPPFFLKVQCCPDFFVHPVFDAGAPEKRGIK